MKRSIEEQLVGIGNMIEAARRATRSLSRVERNIMDRVHGAAIQAGFGWNGINALEMEGERGRRGHMAYPIEAHFIGAMEGGPFGSRLRLYNIEGDHPLNHSTVGVSTLFRNRIHIGDLTMLGLWREIVKEQFLIFSWYVLSAWEVFKIKIGIGS